LIERHCSAVPFFNIIKREVINLKKILDNFIKKYKAYKGAAFYLITGIILSLISLFLFVNIVQNYYKLGSFWFDEKIFNYLHSLRSEGLNTFFKMITSVGYPVPMAILTLVISVYLLYLKKKKESLYFLSNILGVWLFNETLKYIFKRSRPIGSRLIDAIGYSFPSGHAMVFMGFSLILIYLILMHFKSRKMAYIISIIVFILAILVGISRVYLGVHYFSDVIAGWLVGFLWASTSIVVHRTIIHKKVSR
jgi:undecaprenyl-diphosphatase